MHIAQAFFVKNHTQHSYKAHMTHRFPFLGSVGKIENPSTFPLVSVSMRAVETPSVWNMAHFNVMTTQKIVKL